MLGQAITQKVGNVQKIGGEALKRGRPKIEINWKEAEQLCALQCTEQEIADWFRCSVATIERRLREDKNSNFAEFFTMHRVRGKISLRRKLWNLADKHPSMAIFLAKNWLGMIERTEIANPPGEAFRIEHDAKTKLLSALNRLAARATEAEGDSETKQQ